MSEPRPREFRRSYETSDFGNSRRLCRRWGHRMAWCAERGIWLVRDGRHWEWDTTGQVFRWAVETMLYAREVEWALAPEGDEDAIRSWTSKALSEYRLGQMTKFAQKAPGMAVSMEVLDADPWLLGVENGTLDLRTGKLREARAEDWITKPLEVAYDPGAEAPVFRRFLRQVQPDEERREYLQRLAGYSLVGTVSEQVLVLLHGYGANGKTTFLEALAHVLGPLAAHTDSATLTGKRDQHPEAIARLDGTRLVVSMEVERGSRLREGLVKSITGGEPVRARFMYGDSFEYEPAYTVWMPCNDLPEVSGSDKGIWRRLVPIPWQVTIGERDRDKGLPRKLEDEAPGILAWAVEGALRWQQRGLSRGVPAAVVQAKNEYRSAMDHIGRFLAEACTRDPDGFTPSGTLYQAWKEWCGDEGLKPGSKVDFGRRLQHHGIGKARRSVEGRRQRVRTGVELRTEWHDRLTGDLL